MFHARVIRSQMCCSMFAKFSSPLFYSTKWVCLIAISWVNLATPMTERWISFASNRFHVQARQRLVNFSVIHGIHCSVFSKFADFDARMRARKWLKVINFIPRDICRVRTTWHLYNPGRSERTWHLYNPAKINMTAASYTYDNHRHSLYRSP